MERKVPSAKPYIPGEDMPALLSDVKKSLESGWLTLGPYGKKFEEAFSKYIGTQFAVSVSSGTSALEIALRSLIKQGDEIIVPTNTFIATPNAVLFAGGKPIFADVSPETLCLERAISKTRKDSASLKNVWSRDRSVGKCARGNASERNLLRYNPIFPIRGYKRNGQREHKQTCYYRV